MNSDETVSDEERPRCVESGPAESGPARSGPAESVQVEYVWRGVFTNAEIHPVHAEAFDTRLYDESEWNWVDLCEQYSLGWVVARVDGAFAGFVNVLWDGFVHAFIEDVMVAAQYRGRGIGVGLVHAARDGARSGGCEFLHVGFDDDLAPFYIGACGFAPTGGGLMELG